MKLSRGTVYIPVAVATVGAVIMDWSIASMIGGAACAALAFTHKSRSEPRHAAPGTPQTIR